MTSRFFKILLFSLAIFAGSHPARAQGDFLPELVKRIKPSAVAIETFDSKGATLARGSGFFISSDKVITNRHVIEKSTRVEIHLVNCKRYTAKGVLAIDGEGDLALLQVDIPKEFAIPLTLAKMAPLQGESIVVIGNPFGLEGSVSNGIVSAVRDRAFEPERIADNDDRFAFERRAFHERKRHGELLWNIDREQREIAFAVDRQNAFCKIFRAVHQVNFDARGFFDNVAIGDYPVVCDKKSAAARKRRASRIERFDRDRRRLDAFYKLRQIILRSDAKRAGKNRKRKK